jgi:hypothetical protein
MDQPSSVPSSAKPIVEPPQASGTSTILLVVISLLIGLLIGVMGFVAWQKNMAPATQVTPVPSTPLPTPSSTTPEAPATSTPPTSATTTNIDPTAALLNVQWKAGTIVVPGTVFGSVIPKNELRVASPGGYEGGIDEALPMYGFTYDFYEQGRVTDGAYKDSVIYGAKQRTAEVDLGMDRTQAPSFVNLLVSPTTHEVTIIGMASSNIFTPGWTGIRYAPNLKLNLSPFPATLTLENGSTLRRAFLSVSAEAAPLCGGSSGCIDRLPLAHTNDGRGVYAGPSGNVMTTSASKPGCVILYRENGEGVIYESGIPSAIRDPQAGDNADYPAALVVGPRQLVWDPAYATTSTFRAHESGGCGGTDCLRVLAADELNAQDLVQAGKTDGGDPIYVFKQEALNRHPSIVVESYENWYGYDEQTNTKPPIGVFLQRVKVPLFFWKDAFGRYVVYKNTLGAPITECGKPVIYLYPTKTQNVQVQLPSFINVTVSEPRYPKAGWNVSADPSGKLTLKDGSSVGSLFWEGLGVNYTVPKEGFVVKHGQVESFLNQTLPRYGLNAQEQKEFMDFWVPRMTGAPYYRVSFLTNDWSKQVPLNVTPAPQTSIRLFMDWQRLAGPIELVAPTITTPTRNGFTLVEWGGSLR